MATKSDKKKGKQEDHIVPPQMPTKRELAMNIGGVPKKHILLFTQNLAVMLNAGSPLTEALAVLHSNLKGKLKLIVAQVYRKVERGEKLGKALKEHGKYFSPMYINMISVGEYSGRLAENLTQLAEQLQKQHELKRKIVGASMYPAIVLIGGVILSIGIALFILPNVAELFSNFKVDLPFTTQIILNISEFFEKNGLLAIVEFVGAIVAIVFLLKRKFMRPITHWLILHIPLVRSMSQHVNMALMCHVISVLLESGVTIDQALKISRKSVTNHYYKRFLKKAEEEITGGKRLSQLMGKYGSLFPKTDVQILHVGERSGALSTSMTYCAQMHERALDEDTKNLTTMLEPILLVLIGFMVGFLALSIITPLYSITGTLKT